MPPKRAATKKVAKKTSAAKAKKVATVKKTVAKKSVKKVAAKKSVVKKAAAKKAVAKKPVVKKAAPKKVVAKKAATKEAVAKKAPPKKVAEKKVPAKKVVTKKAAPKKVVVKKSTPTKTVKPATKKVVAKKIPEASAPKKTAAKKVAAKKADPNTTVTTAIGSTTKGKTKVKIESALENDILANVEPLQQTVASGAAGPIDFSPYVPQDSEEYMSESQMVHFQNILHRWKQDLLDEMDRTVLHMKDEAANYPDPNDRATQEEEFSLELRTRDRERKLIKKIDETLILIERDEYGYCNMCGVEIGIRRLEARPTATLCIDCKTLEEIREKQLAS